MKNNLSIAILGPGSVGGFLASVLTKNHLNVTCIARETTSQLIHKNGIKLESPKFGQLHVYPRVVTRLDFSPDFLFITTKSVTLTAAIQHIEPECIRNSVIIPLLNGVEHMELLRAIWGGKVMGGSIGNVELKRVSPVHIIHGTPSVIIELSDENHALHKKVEEISKILMEAGIKTVTRKSELDLLWSKLVRLNAIACTTLAANKSLGFIRSDMGWRKQLTRCIEEGCSVALAQGVIIDSDEVMAHIDSLPASLETSLARDFNAGRPSELDAISGAVIRKADYYGVDCPTVKNLNSMIEARL